MPHCSGSRVQRAAPSLYAIEQAVQVGDLCGHTEDISPERATKDQGVQPQTYFQEEDRSQKYYPDILKYLEKPDLLASTVFDKSG